MSRERWGRFFVACAVGAAAVTVDQVTKALARTELSETERIPLLGDLLGLQLAFNPGTVMSLGSGATWLLTLISSVAVVVLAVLAIRARSVGWAGGIGRVWGGAIGNLIDRLFGYPGLARGWVTDFLAYGNLFIGNLADVLLGVGVLVLGIEFLRDRNAQRRADSHPGDSAYETPAEAPRGQ